MTQLKPVNTMMYKLITYITTFLRSAFCSGRVALGLMGLVASLLFVMGFANPKYSQQHFVSQSGKWVGTWSTAPQLVEPHNMPPEPGLSNNILRQIVRVSLGGDSLRIRFSNEFSAGPTTIQEVQIATSEGNGAIDASTTKNVEFNGRAQVMIDGGKAITSDPIAFPLEDREDLAITIHFGTVPDDLTGHPGSRTTSYIFEGDKTAVQGPSEAKKTDHWYIISGMQVKAPESAAAVAIIGNSITDGRGSGTNEQNRWPDILSERLLHNPETQNVAVLNQGIGGNAVLRGGLGPTALDRFDRDILDQKGVRWAIVMEGVNDLGATKDSATAFQVAKNLIAAYNTMIDKAHDRNIKIYGGTITPIKESFYYKDFRESARQYVNKWIRNSGRFDAVIDFDKAIRNPEDTLVILPKAHSGDYLHPNELGYKIMGEAVDLSLFE
ncbi:SGNH/GDSL hydrolase family protein [Zunongwangia sp. F260]|uniref:SGNH/GDSL hydrolase family protein n=1 Tax=Autumnicola lenta TaxID=3075593 RepID=A0ABU3CPR6_9FLAO|nr:SGNH/GDSL hydrolase family protein [Zunongwangia sp. F260]MDT0648350.1 SGNH/GDSL hydrolase family protein [Zunongwangia sp. F260]